MSKAVATKANTEVSTHVTNLAEWGEAMPLGQDIVISKILPMQGMSKLVMDGKAAVGEFRDSLSGDKMGSIAEPIHLIPFHVQKFWDILLPDEQGKFKWSRTEPLIEDPVNPGYNDNLPWQDKDEAGNQIKRVRRMNFFMLVPGQVADGSAIPYLLSFKSTSYKEGKKLLTQMYLRNRKVGLPPPGYTIMLGGKKEKNAEGTWVLPEYTLDRKTTVEEMSEALNWYKLINKGGVKVDESDLEETSGPDIDVTGVPETGTGAF